MTLNPDAVDKTKKKDIKIQKKLVAKKKKAMAKAFSSLYMRYLTGNRFVIGANELQDFLLPTNGITDYNNLAGWRISYVADGKVKFTQVKKSGYTGGVASETIIDENQYVLHSFQYPLPGDKIDKDAFFPAIAVLADGTLDPTETTETVDLDFYFLNASEFELTVNRVNQYSFSLGFVLPDIIFETPMIDDLVVPVMKIEAFDSATPPTQTIGWAASPSLLLAPPCPPFWKPGYSGYAD